ncbi:MAG: cytochrome C oxidase subunit IV family protein [Rhodobacter sp.]|nr:cytochrome C oxidase subunit IV family protein [Paracoccaceae bacterium]MCC0080924.1 cytochrome C oxidase subunit IV family protein [Rhodobacter sp.]
MTEIDRDRGRYLIGAGLSALLTILAFAAVALGLSRGVALGIIGVTAVAQVIVQLRCFLHIDFSRQKREDLQLILFSLLLLAIMAGGTLWILANLAQRMM